MKGHPYFWKNINDMNKKIFFTGFMLFGCAMISKAQLANTKWGGTMFVPTEAKVTLIFKQDTLLMWINDMAMVGETMTYTSKDSTITLNKVSGNSPCDSAAFTLKYHIVNNMLYISNLIDACDPRVQAWPTTPFAKL